MTAEEPPERPGTPQSPADGEPIELERPDPADRETAGRSPRPDRSQSIQQAGRAAGQAANRAAGVISRFLTEFDPQPLTDALTPLTQRLGLTPELDGVAVETTLLFSDLAGFSSWVLQAGDDRALEVLRHLGTATEPLLSPYHGRLVKRLGSGHMIVFRRPRDGLGAALAMLERMAAVEPAGDNPQLRIGLHLGTPQRVDGDYFGTDVNIAARLAEAARPGEVLASGQVIANVGSDMLAGLVLQRRPFRAKGAPPELEVFAVANPLI